jgi:hypothetical protein
VSASASSEPHARMTFTRSLTSVVPSPFVSVERR